MLCVHIYIHTQHIHIYYILSRILKETYQITHNIYTYTIYSLEFLRKHIKSLRKPINSVRI